MKTVSFPAHENSDSYPESSIEVENDFLACFDTEPFIRLIPPPKTNGLGQKTESRVSCTPRLVLKVLTGRYKGFRVDVTWQSNKTKISTDTPVNPGIVHTM